MLRQEKHNSTKRCLTQHISLILFFCLVWTIRGAEAQFHVQPFSKQQKVSASGAKEEKVDDEIGLLESSYGVPQKWDGPHWRDTLMVFEEMKEYMDFLTPKMDEFTRGHCIMLHESCTEWAARGECESNRLLMLPECGPACQSCHMLPLDPRHYSFYEFPLEINPEHVLPKVWKQVSRSLHFSLEGTSKKATKYWKDRQAKADEAM